ncbi:hypothetical protein [Chelativorans sp. M5D2P16]|uniref:hypothetical protein n=1 Tax=Chelativorans sp. M5D2P16 TaxID=3095678 RepID=UPI002ACAA5C1|nr:hypothetical protein [Chelativorans sp. M5D2P16]MDZ5697814.1 hypothetical protein [Chelativorans sp. M5D2P16]
MREAARILYPGASPATWNRQVVTPVRAIINFAAEEGLCDHFRMKRFPEGQKRQRPAGDNDDESRKVIDQVFGARARRRGNKA